jgi:hypothetical protein
METPTPLVSLDDLDKPVLQTEDTTFPAPNSTDINPINGLRTDYRSADTHATTDEELASHGVGVSNISPPIASLEGTADTSHSNREGRTASPAPSEPICKARIESSGFATGN